VVTPAHAGSRFPQLSTGPDGVAMSWLTPTAGGYELRFATWDGGDWDAPRLVASGSDWFVNWADFPTVVSAGNGRVAAHWLVQRPEHEYSYEIRVATSRDAGATWSTAAAPHDDDTPTEHGFVSWLRERDGWLAVWLDGRNTGGHGGGHDADGHGGGDMTLRAARIDDAGRIGDDAWQLDARVCDCCQTDAALTPEGGVVVYRDRSENEHRDIAIVRLEIDGWTAPHPVHADGWRISACPVNGPAVSALGRAVAVAWFTAPDQPRVRLAFSTDAGRTFAPPIEVAAGKVAGRVDVLLLDEKSAVVSWIDGAAPAPRLLAQIFGPEGPRAPAVTIANTDVARSSGFPRMARDVDGVLFAWTEPGDTPAIRAAHVALD
jgi:hypothetical protein